MSIWNLSVFLCLESVKTLQILFPDTEYASLKYVFDVKSSLSSMNTLSLLKETNSVKAAKSCTKMIKTGQVP